MARMLLRGARGVADAARHLAWYISYCVDGSAVRETPLPLQQKHER